MQINPALMEKLAIPKLFACDGVNGKTCDRKALVTRLEHQDFDIA